jgi:hypothetical protein
MNDDELLEELHSEEDTRVFEVGTIVKMNPFTVQRAIHEYSSDPFEGERAVIQARPEDADVHVKDSNYWRRQDLLVKGVDYVD